jgi:hypothetical protein
MSVNYADGMKHVTRAEWEALWEQCERVLADNAQIRDEALRAKSEAVEQRLRSEDRDNAAVDQQR